MPAGRPAIEITQELCKRAETLAAQGLTMDQIAVVLNMSRGTLFDKQAKYTDFSDAIKAGRQKGIAVVTNALMETAKSGNVAAQIFYLKNRDKENWKDAQDLNVNTTVKHTTLQTAHDRITELIGEGEKESPPDHISH